MMIGGKSAIWRIGGWLNLVQSTFVGLLRVLSVPIVLMLSVASGYTTFYGLKFFITPWIALIITIAVQSIVVICSLELAGIHWRANPSRYLMVVVSLLVALIVSISFSYFKFYEFSQKEGVQLERIEKITLEVNHYLESVATLRSQLSAKQRQRVDAAREDTTQAYLGTYPGMVGRQVGKGRMWTYQNEVLLEEQERLKGLEERGKRLEKPLTETREALQGFVMSLDDIGGHERLMQALQDLRGSADTLAAHYGEKPVEPPHLVSYAELTRPITPTLAMWFKISWFALACAAMVDFFTLILSYRLEMTAPGPLTEEEQELAYQGLRQFSQFTINENDELEFRIEKTELERARRVSDWQRMFAVAFLLNRGYLRKMNSRRVEFAPNLYPIIAEKMSRQSDRQGEEEPLALAMRKKFHG